MNNTYIKLNDKHRLNNHHIISVLLLIIYILLSSVNSTAVLAADDPLKIINKQFRQKYAQLRDSIQQQTKPIVYQMGSSLYLEKSDGSSEKASAVGPLYHKLKGVSHIPFTVYIMLNPYTDKPIPQGILKDLSSYQNLLIPVRESLITYGFSKTQLERQKAIINESDSILNYAIQHKTIKKQELLKFTHSQAIYIKANLAEVARSQINTMHTQMQTWKQQLSKDEWSRLRIVISGSHMPRVGNIAVQYFSVLKNQTYEGKYQQENILNSDFSVIYTESIFKKQDAIAVMAAHILDEGAGEYFFNDKQRMHRDILADDAEKIINELFNLEKSVGREIRH